MKEDLRHMYEDLKCKSEDNCQLERNVTDLRAKLNQTCCQLKEADGRLACLHDKVVGRQGCCCCCVLLLMRVVVSCF
ncbi:hypothetical protein BsWGS_08609 [Bradybaena similaris]